MKAGILCEEAFRLVLCGEGLGAMPDGLQGSAGSWLCSGIIWKGLWDHMRWRGLNRGRLRAGQASSLSVCFDGGET